jgi:hypothetical protein
MHAMVNGIEVWTFEREWRDYTGGPNIVVYLMSMIAVHLPGLPPPDMRGQYIESAVRKLGGTVPSPYSLGTVDDWLIATRHAHHNPTVLDGVVNVLTLQVASLPPGFWMPLS